MVLKKAEFFRQEMRDCCFYGVEGWEGYVEAVHNFAFLHLQAERKMLVWPQSGEVATPAILQKGGFGLVSFRGSPL